MNMFNGKKPPLFGNEAIVWEPIIQAWRDLPEDEECVLVSDIAPTGFSDADIASSEPKSRALSWVWRKA